MLKPSQTTPTLILVDAYSLLFRAFFAGQDLRTRDGRSTGALYGFANMLFSIVSSEKPFAMVVCWDAHAPTLRHQEFEAYKAHRPNADPRLVEQMPTARELVTAMGIQSAEAAGYEADDLIGTLAFRGREQGYEVTIYTGDSDQLQLVGGPVRVRMTRRGVSEVTDYDAEAVRARYGVGPDQIADFKALTGDTSDNIPGVPGIGEKTAAALLQKFDTLENLLTRLEEVTPPRIRELLLLHSEQARASRSLTSIVCNADFSLALQPYLFTDENRQNLLELFENLEFRSLQGKIRLLQQERESVIQDAASSPQQNIVACTTVQGSAELQQAADALEQAKRIALVAHLQQGTSGRTSLLQGIAFAFHPDRAWYLPCANSLAATAQQSLFAEENSVSAETAALLHALLQTPGKRRIVWNAAALYPAFWNANLHLQPVQFDVLLAAYLLDAGKSGYSVARQAEIQLGGMFIPSDPNLEGASAMAEAACLLALDEPLHSQLQQQGMMPLLEDIEMPLSPILAEIQRQGLLVDLPYLQNLGEKMGSLIEQLTADIYSLAGTEFNIGSPKQLQEVLFEKLQLPHGRKTKTGYSTDADVLEQLAAKHEICRKILDYREQAKLKATYTDALARLADPVTHRVHTTLHQTVASTGRLSSSDPNLQNIPVRSEAGREIRRAFIAPPGRLLLSCDYSQVELRVLAHMSGDETLREAFRHDEDIHAATASTVFGVPVSEVTSDQRRQAKTINFAVIYGQSAFSLAATLGVENSVAAGWIEEYFSRLPGVRQFVEETKTMARNHGYVETLLGRRRYVPDLSSPNHTLRQAAERAAVNMPVQGTAADIMKLAMKNVHLWLKDQPECTLLLQVHDELLFEVDESELARFTKPLQSLMENAFQLNVPLRVDAKSGPNWAVMHS